MKDLLNFDMKAIKQDLLRTLVASVVVVGVLIALYLTL